MTTRKIHKPDQGYRKIRNMKPSGAGTVIITVKGKERMINKTQALYDAGDPVVIKKTDTNHKITANRASGRAVAKRSR